MRFLAHPCLVAFVLAAAASCATTTDPSLATGDRGRGDAGPGVVTDTDPTSPDPDSDEAPATPPLPSGLDPFAPQADESEGLTNTSRNLPALLENGTLEGACDRYRSGHTDKKTMLLCGKWMFFYESFGTAGVPAPIVKFLAKNFPDELGLGFSKLGMVPDPGSSDHIPLGLAPTAKINGSIDAYAFTCASCHFGKLSDGRYAVGAPNHAYDYASHILAIALAPSVGMGTGSAADHDPDAVAKVQPVINRLKGDLALKAKFGLALVPLLSLQNPGITKEVEAQYASWPTGTLDFIIAPLPLDDHVEVVGKMLGLWGIPREAEVTKNGMSSAMLAWTGAVPSLHDFLGGFAIVGGVKAPTDAELAPLAEYIYSLRAPANPQPPAPALVADGARLFETKGCAKCHDGPRGSGKRSFTFDEIGTDDALSRWLDPELSGGACCGVSLGTSKLTHGVKSPRLVGMWAQRRFLHNGSLSTLEQLFCLEPRPNDHPTPLRADGHTFTCEGATDPEKRALIAYLLAH